MKTTTLQYALSVLDAQSTHASDREGVAYRADRTDAAQAAYYAGMTDMLNLIASEAYTNHVGSVVQDHGCHSIKRGNGQHVAAEPPTTGSNQHVCACGYSFSDREALVKVTPHLSDPTR